MMEHEFRESSGVLYVGVWLDVPGYLVRPRKVRGVQRAKLISLKGGWVEHLLMLKEGLVLTSKFSSP